MYKPVYNIKIETDASYAGRSDIYTAERDEKLISITHKVGGFMHKKDKPVTKKITDTEYQPIIEAFENIDFQKVFKESGDSFGCDGWCLKVTISKIMSGISVSLWCPSKNSAIPETTKLLKACDKIFDFFPEEYRKC